MNPPFDPELDLKIERLIKAPRSAVWHAWTDPASFAQWWIPAPAICRVARMELVPGGALVTEMSENGGAFGPHLDACYLAIEPEQRIVFTNALSGGWRPAAEPFITAVITLGSVPIRDSRLSAGVIQGFREGGLDEAATVDLVERCGVGSYRAFVAARTQGSASG